MLCVFVQAYCWKLPGFSILRLRYRELSVYWYRTNRMPIPQRLYTGSGVFLCAIMLLTKILIFGFSPSFVYICIHAFVCRLSSAQGSCTKLCLFTGCGARTASTVRSEWFANPVIALVLVATSE